MKLNVIILGDTRLGQSHEKQFQRMWGGKVLLNSLSSNKRGIVALIKDNSPITDIGWENIIPGYFSRLTFKSEGHSVLIKCIYAPNEDSNPNDIKNESSLFFNTVLDDTNDDMYDHRLIAGDFNIALDHNLDTSGYLHINNPNSRELLIRHANLSNLVDIWRLRNPESQQFTFSKKTSPKSHKSPSGFFLLLARTRLRLLKMLKSVGHATFLTIGLFFSK